MVGMMVEKEVVSVCVGRRVKVWGAGWGLGRRATFGRLRIWACMSCKKPGTVVKIWCLVGCVPPSTETPGIILLSPKDRGTD